MSNKIIYCLDCKEDFYNALRKYGFEIVVGYLGYSQSYSKFVRLTEPPNECDVMVFNLTDPACFDRRKWGPNGGNDAYKCKIVDKVTKSIYIIDDGFGSGKKYPRFQRILESQINKNSSTFNYSHLQKAIWAGGIDCVYYLNPALMFHSLHNIPNWIGFSFETDIAKVRKWNINKDASKIYEPLKEIGTGDLKLCSPIEFKLLELRPSLSAGVPAPVKLDLLTNNVNECLAAIVKLGKGFIYFLPPFTNPVKATVKLIEDLLPNFKHSYNELLQKQIQEAKERMQPRKKISEKIYGPGDQYSFYKDLKEIVGGGEKEVFIIDSYANEEIFDLYVNKVKKDVKVRFLTKNPPKNLITVITKFRAKPSTKFEAKKTNEIHDRVIFIDEKQCWVIGHSIKDAAVKKPTYLIPIESLVDMKNLYEAIWGNATNI